MPITDSSKPWWEHEDDTKAIKAATSLFQDYVAGDQARLSAQDMWNRLYSNRDLSGHSQLASFASSFNSDSRKFSRVPINVAKVMIDGVHARIVRQAIAIKFLTETHNFDSRSGARQMERYVDFQEHQQGGEKIATQAFLDALVGGTGIVATVDKFGEYDVEQQRVRASDVFADPSETPVLAQPSNMFRREWVSRHRLKAMFPQYAEKIEKAGELTPEDRRAPQSNNLQDRRSLVEVVHGWKLPSFEDAGDGRFIQFVDNQVIRSEEWKINDYPLSFIRCQDDSSTNFWGLGLCEQLVGIHFDINTSFFSVYRTIEMMPRPVLFMTTGAKVKTQKIGNVEGLVVESVDGSPRLELPMSVPTDIVNVISMQWYKALEISGLSSLSLPQSAGGGLETGQAMRDFNDIQSTELAPKFKDWQDFRVRLSEQIVSSGKRVSDRAESEGSKYTVVMAKDQYTIEEIDWKNISLDPRKDSYVIQALPASALSQTFAGKKADVLDLLAAGLIDREQALALLAFPDISEFYDAVTASRKAIEREIEEILTKNKPVPFDPNNNLRLGLKMYQESISKAQAMNVPSERINLLRNNVSVILSLIEKEQMATRNMAAGFGPGLPGSPPAMDINGASPQANAEGQMSNAN
jgi:hypothetical protein